MCLHTWQDFLITFIADISTRCGFSVHSLSLHGYITLDDLNLQIQNRCNWTEELSVRHTHVKCQQQADSVSFLWLPRSMAFMCAGGCPHLCDLGVLVLTICIVCAHRPEGPPNGEKAHLECFISQFSNSNSYQKKRCHDTPHTVSPTS